MAAHHHSSVFVCGHCGAEFSGRKRKFCTAKCQQEAANQRKVDRGIKRSTGKKRRPPHPIIDGKRVCLDCCRNLPIEEFPVSKAVKSGYRGQCKACFAEFNRKRRPQRTPVQRKLERIRAATHRGECGPPTRKEYWERLEKLEPIFRRSQRRLEREAEAAWNKWLMFDAPDDWCNRYWAAKGAPWRSRGIGEAERWRLRYRGDPKFAAKQRVRAQVNKAMKRNRVSDLIRSAIKRKGNSPRLEVMLGYTVSDLCRHLEKQFTKGMSWDRFMAGEIHIDHITPQAAFDLTDDEQWRACWCLSNLRPCWAKENLKKSAKQVFLL